MRVAGTMYPVAGIEMPWQVNARIRKLEPLDCSLLEDESKAILKQTLFCENGKGSVSILFLEPGAKVRRHQHVRDCEFYISWNACKGVLKTEFCNKGESHELENTSEKRWAWVLSIKFDMPPEE